MLEIYQKTLSEPAKFKGVGLHSGKISTVTVLPGPVDQGVVFKRTDLKENNIIIPGIFNVSSANFCTTISNDIGVSVSTIEHLMGALFILGVDNAVIEINNNEVPILDGSAKVFVEKITKTGLEASNQPIRIIKINKRIDYVDGSKSISLEPNNINFEIDFNLEYSNPIIGNQNNHINVYEDDLSDIINSRTFCLYEDIEKIKKFGFAKGGSLENALVVDNDKVINEDGLRNKKEFVNHKILDCIGDLYTCGYRMLGNVKCSQGGHYLTNQLLKKVFKDKKNFSIVEIKERNLPHSIVNRSLLRSIA